MSVLLCATRGASASSGCFNNCTAIILSIAILLSGLRAASGAPTTNEQEWWINPCSKQPLIRHGRSAAENQLKMFLEKIDLKFTREIKELYKSAENLKFKGNCPRINNMLKPIKTAHSFTSATQAFYETLLQFAVFIDKLEKTPIRTKGEFNFSKRRDIFIEAKGNLRLVICEFNDTLSKYDGTSLQPAKPKVPKINMKCLPRHMDHSVAHFMDIDFFKKLQKFLKQSRRALKMKKRKGARRNKNRGNNKRTKQSMN